MVGWNNQSNDYNRRDATDVDDEDDRDTSASRNAAAVFYSSNQEDDNIVAQSAGLTDGLSLDAEPGANNSLRSITLPEILRGLLMERNQQDGNLVVQDRVPGVVQRHHQIAPQRIDRFLLPTNGLINLNTLRRNRSSRRFIERLRRNMRSTDESSNGNDELDNTIEDFEPRQQASPNLSSLVERYLSDNGPIGTTTSNLENLFALSTRNSMRSNSRYNLLNAVTSNNALNSRRSSRVRNADIRRRGTACVDNGSLTHIKNIYSADFLKSVQFPTALDETKMSGNLVLIDKYTAKFKEDNAATEAGLVKSDNVIPPHCGVYYFEVKVHDKGQQGVVAVGLTDSQVTHKSLPGWDINSYGYHGDDGNIFIGNGKGNSYGPGYLTGDIIGCCLNFIDKKCFFTKNGANIGVAFTNLINNLYVTIGMRHDRTNMTVNFGQERFLFNIDEYVYNVRLSNLMNIKKSNAEDNFLNQEIQKLVLSYMLFNGYIESAQLFAKKIGQTIEVENYKKIKYVTDLIKSGHSGAAAVQIHQNYPKFFKQQPSILFELRMQQYVEKILHNDNENVDPSEFLYDICKKDSPDNRSLPPGETASQSSPSGGVALLSGDTYIHNEIEMTDDSKQDANETEQSLNLSNNDNSMDFGEEMNIVSEFGVEKPDDSAVEIESLSACHNNANPTVCPQGFSFPNIDLINSYFNPSQIDSQLAQMSQTDNFEFKDITNLKNLLIFGHLLYQAGTYLLSEGMITSHLYDKMMQIFGLIVVKDVDNSPLKHLTSNDSRLDLARCMNSAILEYLNKAPFSNIDVLMSQITMCYQKIVDRKVKYAAFLDISDICN